jgi:DNA primase
MAIPREIIDQIRERTDIVEVVQRHVSLKRRGNSWLGLCPFHQEKTPSFNVVPTKGIYHCFGCGEGGDVFKFIMRMNGLGFMDAVRELAGPAGVTVEERELSPTEKRRIKKRATLYDVCEAASSFYQQVLLARPEGAPGRAYLEQRGITHETIERFRIGYAPNQWSALIDHLHSRGYPEELAVAAGLARSRERSSGSFDFFRGRVMFPILDERDRVLTFGGRLVEDQSRDGREAPKYFNGPESEIYVKQRVLYGLSHARNAIQREQRAILVEGYFDVVTLAQAGIEEVVAPCGTALTADQLRILRRFSPRVVALFDADQAGIKAAVRSMPLFAEAQMDALRLEIPDAKDPDEFVREHGKDAFRELLGKTEPLMDLVVRFQAERHGATPLGRQRAMEQLAPLVAAFPEVARASLVRRIADLLYLPEAQVARQIRRVRAGPPDHGHPQDAPAPQRPDATRYTRGLHDLLWLLVHFPEQVAPLVEEVDPALISDSHAVLDCIGALIHGESLTTAMDAAGDEGLQRMLASVAAKQGLYAEDRAQAAAQQILARLELPRIQRRLVELHRAIDAGDPGSPSWRDLISERTRLIMLQKPLKAILQGRFDTR